MKRLAMVLIAISVPIAPTMGRGQSRTLSAARLHVTVEIDSRNVFLYRYTVENSAASTAGVSKITIDISLPPGASATSANGLAHGAGYFAESLAARRNSTARTAIPVGLSAPQPGWTTTVGADGAARWVAVQDASFVMPKQKLEGFSLTSHGPPSLRQFALVPHIDRERAPVMEPGDDPGESDRYKQEFEQYVESQTVVGMTLAPTATVAVTPDALLANLSGQIAQARSARWISSDVVTRNLTDKLLAARTAISRRQLDSAGNILRTVRNEAAAQSGKTLASEAVALVSLNVQYVLALLAKP